MVPALIGGDVQCAIAGANAVIAAALGGAPIVSIASLANRPYLRLWAHPEFTRVEELRGKTLGVSRFGSTTDNLTASLYGIVFTSLSRRKKLFCESAFTTASTVILTGFPRFPFL